MRTPLFYVAATGLTLASAEALPPLMPRVARLDSGDVLSVSVLDMNAHEARLHTVLGEVTLPLARIREIRWPESGALVLQESFDAPGASWTGDRPVLTDQRFRSAPKSLHLAPRNQRFARKLDAPIQDGAIAFDYYDDGKVRADARWIVTLSNSEDPQPPVTVEFGWARDYVTAVLSKDFAVPTQLIARRAGWRRLHIAFGPNRLTIASDDAAIVTSLSKGLRRPVSLIELQVLAAAGAGPPVEAQIDDLSVHRTLRPRNRLASDPDQLDVLDQNGDQSFGQLLHATQDAVTIQLSTGIQWQMHWSDIQSLRPPLQTLDTLEWSGNIGVMALTNGDRFLAVAEKSEGGWTIVHPLLGRRHVPSNWIAAFEPASASRRIQVHPGPIHLGDSIESGFENPPPDGLSWQSQFTCDGMAGGDVVLSMRVATSATQRSADYGPVDVVQALCNGKALEPRMAHDKPADVPFHVRTFAVPPGVLHRGRNTLEIRLVPKSRVHPVADVELLQIVLEQRQLGN